MHLSKLCFSDPSQHVGSLSLHLNSLNNLFVSKCIKMHPSLFSSITRYNANRFKEGFLLKKKTKKNKGLVDFGAGLSGGCGAGGGTSPGKGTIGTCGFTLAPLITNLKLVSMFFFRK